MLYFMVTGVMPFRADTVARLKKCILEGQYTIPSYVSDSGQFLIRNILRPVPQDRFTLTEIQKSEWLEGQEFPAELEPYNVNPSQDTSSLSEEEQDARRILKDLGITNEHIQSGHRDSRSSITGTYRIVLHRVQKKKSGLCDSETELRGPDRVSNYDRAKSPPTLKKESKVCTILWFCVRNYTGVIRKLSIRITNLVHVWMVQFFHLEIFKLMFSLFLIKVLYVTQTCTMY